MFASIPISWQKFLSDKISNAFYEQIIKKLKFEYKNFTVYPKKENVFRAFIVQPPEKIKIVVIGQDPYHGENQANGFAFAVNENISPPPSLKNIWQEIENEFGLAKKDKTLCNWANQGVFLLNSVLTVRKNEPSSHKNLNWQVFTDAVVKELSDSKENLVFMLWGSFAKEKSILINKNRNHLILEAAHPSPFSAHKGFFGCNHFLKANDFFIKNGIETINW